MNKHQSLSLVLGYLLPSLLMANNAPNLVNYWQCTAHDAQNKQWIINSEYQLIAINKALDACKKQSQQPMSCKSSRDACEFFLNGVTTRPMWQCTALDSRGKTWRSNIYTHRDDAAFAAKAYCQKKSSIPDTCYMYLMACKNLSARDN